VATVPAATAVTYVLDQTTAWTHDWTKFTFTPASPCNDGATIKFPDHYTGTWARTSPTTLFSAAENKTPPVTITSTAATTTKAAFKSWVVSASKATYKGTYTLTLTAKHGTVSLSKAQVITLTIVDQCDSPTINTPETPAAAKYTMNGKAEYYPVPKIKNVLSKIHTSTKQKTCEFTYTVTVPDLLKGVATYDATKGIKFQSFNGVKAGKYTLTVQAKNGKTVMTNGKYKMSFILERGPETSGLAGVVNTVTISGSLAAGSTAFRPSTSTTSKTTPTRNTGGRTT